MRSGKVSASPPSHTHSSPREETRGRDHGRRQDTDAHILFRCADLRVPASVVKSDAKEKGTVSSTRAPAPQRRPAPSSFRRAR